MMRILNNTRDQIALINFHNEVGSWEFQRKESKNEVVISQITTIVNEFTRAFPWTNITRIGLFFGDRNGNLIEPWNESLGNISDWLESLNIDSNQLEDILFEFELECIISDSLDNELLRISDSAGFTILFSKEARVLDLVLFININIFSPITWGWNDELNEKYDIQIGADNSKFNRNQLKRSLELFEQAGAFEIIDQSSENMNNIYEYGFKDDTSQFSF